MRVRHRHRPPAALPDPLEGGDVVGHVPEVRRRPPGPRRGRAATCASPVALVTPPRGDLGEGVGGGVGDRRACRRRRRRRASTNSSRREVLVPGQQLGDRLRRPSPPASPRRRRGRRRPSAACRSARAGTRVAVLDGEPGAGLPTAELAGDRRAGLGAQRVLVEHLERARGPAAPRRCSRPRCRRRAPRGRRSIQRGGRPVASTSGTPSARQRSSSARVAVADRVVPAQQRAVDVAGDELAAASQTPASPAPARPRGSGRRRRRREPLVRSRGGRPHLRVRVGHGHARPPASATASIIGRSLGMSPNTRTSAEADAVVLEGDRQPGGLGDPRAAAPR